MKFATLASALIATSAASSVTFGVFSDLHMQIHYNPDSSANRCGRPNWDESLSQIESEIRQPTLISGTSEQKAILGRVGCDAPVSLVKYMTHLFNQVNAGKRIDYITLNGDIVSHKVATDYPNDPSNPTKSELAAIAKHYSILKESHTLA